MNKGHVIEAASRLWGNVELDEDVRMAGTAKVLELIMDPAAAATVVEQADSCWPTPLDVIILDGVHAGAIRLS